MTLQVPEEKASHTDKSKWDELYLIFLRLQSLTKMSLRIKLHSSPIWCKIISVKIMKEFCSVSGTGTFQRHKCSRWNYCSKGTVIFLYQPFNQNCSSLSSRVLKMQTNSLALHLCLLYFLCTLYIN